MFAKSMLRGASAGLGVMYNDLASDLEGVNFSSIRQGALDIREHWKELQEWLIEALCKPVREEWMKCALLGSHIALKNGKPLPPEKLQIYSELHCQPRRWSWIDPKSEINANVTAIRAGLTSLSQVIREQGRDPDQVAQELADDYERFKVSGIPSNLLALFFGLLPAPEASPSKADESVAPEPKGGKP